jgi:hypothetical protein
MRAIGDSGEVPARALFVDVLRSLVTEGLMTKRPIREAALRHCDRTSAMRLNARAPCAIKA